MMPYAPTSLVYIAADRKHRPLSHPLLLGRAAPLPPTWSVTARAIRERRVARGLSQYSLGRLIGVTRPAVANWERAAAIPTPEHVERLRSVLR